MVLCVQVLSKNLSSQLYGLSKDDLARFQSATASKEKKKEKRIKK